MDEKTCKGLLNNKREVVKEKINSLKAWCIRYKEPIITFGPVIIGGGLSIIKTIIKKSITKDQKSLKDRYIYDRSAGHYFELGRKPKNSEWAQIDRRKRNGEALSIILNDMKLLK